jgi:saccharopine dehydrogenase-like NADP-dependent oxidoreductase
MLRYFGRRFASTKVSTPLTAAIKESDDDDIKQIKTWRQELDEAKLRVSEIETKLDSYRVKKRKSVLVLGAGLSSTEAIRYLLSKAEQGKWQVRVGDSDVAKAQKKVNGSTYGSAFRLDASNEVQLAEEVSRADVVVSLLPMALHPKIAKVCVAQSAHLVTASYMSDEIRQMDADARKKGVLLLNEIGLDPGIDHLASMRTIDRVRREGGDLRSFESFVGGLVAPESDDNPWHYKFTWNPRNVVLAGQGGVQFLQNGRRKYVPYHNVFRRIEMLSVPGYGDFEGYANRDSLKYRAVYGLEGLPTMFRGTLRRPGFCEAWQVLVDLGLTDDSFRIDDSDSMTYRQFVNSFLRYREADSVELKLAYACGLSIDSPTFKMLRWLGLFEERAIRLENATPAEILQSILERKWVLRENDRDMIVMLNKFQYENSRGNQLMELVEHAVVLGDPKLSAMTSTVGRPLAVATELILNNAIDLRGSHIPVAPKLYNPILDELDRTNFIHFESSERVLIQR